MLGVPSVSTTGGHFSSAQENFIRYLPSLTSSHGVGFNKVDKTKMITPYFTTKKNGTGLGLAIVTKIISDHSGLIEFGSIDNGAEVKITLPRIHD